MTSSLIVRSRKPRPSRSRLRDKVGRVTDAPSLLSKAIERWENEGGAPEPAAQTQIEHPVVEGMFERPSVPFFASHNSALLR